MAFCQSALFLDLSFKLFNLQYCAAIFELEFACAMIKLPNFLLPKAANNFIAILAFTCTCFQTMCLCFEILGTVPVRQNCQTSTNSFYQTCDLRLCCTLEHIRCACFDQNSTFRCVQYTVLHTWKLKFNLH